VGWALTVLALITRCSGFMTSMADCLEPTVAAAVIRGSAYEPCNRALDLENSLFRDHLLPVDSYKDVCGKYYRRIPLMHGDKVKTRR
jgi:hypothetical protein